MAGGIPKLLLNIQGRHQELHGLRTEEGHGPQDLEGGKFNFVDVHPQVLTKSIFF